MTIEPPSARHTSYNPDLANQLGATVTVIVTDVFQQYSTGAFDKNCLGTDCVFYRKNCDTAAKKCSYTVGYSRDSKTLVPDYLTIEYHDDHALSAAENSLYLARGERRQSFVSLTDLKMSAPPEPLPLSENRHLQ